MFWGCTYSHLMVSYEMIIVLSAFFGNANCHLANNFLSLLLTSERKANLSCHLISTSCFSHILMLCKGRTYEQTLICTKIFVLRSFTIFLLLTVKNTQSLGLAKLKAHRTKLDLKSVEKSFSISGTSSACFHLVVDCNCN